MEFINKTKDKKVLQLHQGHRERLRSRLVKLNYDAPMHEILEYVLQQPIKRKDTNELAHNLLAHFGSFANICDASIEELMAVKGVGESTAYFLNSLPYLFKTYKDSKSSAKPYLTCEQDVFDFLGETISHLPNEEFYVICLNSSSKVINYKNISAGDGSSVCFNINEVANYCKSLNASQVILLHNHPTSSEQPSFEDIESTRLLYGNLAFSQIDLREHIIVNSNGEMYSFKRAGYIDKFKKSFDEISKIGII